MFGYCVWFELVNNNAFVLINKTLSKIASSQIHIPHITLEYNIIKKNGIEKLDSYKPTIFYKKGDVYQDNIVNFYALQQDYIRGNDDKVYHVSLAYKANNKFTEKDIVFANSLNIPKIIRPEDLNVSLWNCDSIYTKDWYKI